MSFRLALPIAAAIYMITLPAITEGSDLSQPFVTVALGAARPMQISVTGDLKRTAAGILGHRYPASSIRYWRADGKTAWVLEAKGRSRLITAGFIVQGDKIINSKVLAYRESRGGEIQRSSFTKQFVGVKLGRNRKLSKRIHSITGATISVTAMKNMARLALYLETQLPPRGE